MWRRREKTGTTVERFKRYLEIDLLPHLNGNSVLIMDNMKSHHAKAVRNLLDSSSVRYIYLPPYSPDLNPIEKLWSTVKSFLRKFKARTLDALPNAIQCAFQTVSPSDCSGWFHSCGYSPYFENCYKTHFAGTRPSAKSQVDTPAPGVCRSLFRVAMS